VLSARIGVLGRTFAWAGNAGLGRACRAASVRAGPHGAAVQNRPPDGFAACGEHLAGV